MTAINQRRNRVFLISGLAVVGFVIYSLLTPLLVQIIQFLFRNEDAGNQAINSPGFSYFSWQRWFEDVNVTAFFFSWFFILLVLLPYSVFYLRSRLRNYHPFLKYLLFFLFMIAAGLLIVPWGFITEFFLQQNYPQKVLLLLVVTLMVCPMVNYILNKHLANRSMQ
jgi:hypothetical protein